jgi:hypothetical protein
VIKDGLYECVKKKCENRKIDNISRLCILGNDANECYTYDENVYLFFL